jgi:hypothetical protein
MDPPATLLEPAILLEPPVSIERSQFLQAMQLTTRGVPSPRVNQYGSTKFFVCSLVRVQAAQAELPAPGSGRGVSASWNAPAAVGASGTHRWRKGFATRFAAPPPWSRPTTDLRRLQRKARRHRRHPPPCYPLPAATPASAAGRLIWQRASRTRCVAYAAPSRKPSCAARSARAASPQGTEPAPQ